MKLPTKLHVLKRISILDVLTIAILGVAVAILVRTDSPVRASVMRWSALRDMQRNVERNWSSIASVAIPLHRGSGQPEIIEFSDYECPFCRAATPYVDSAIAAGARIALIHVPLRIHPAARPAALAAICAQRIGRFDDIHHFFMTTKEWRSDTAWAQLPVYAELAQNATFDRCLSDPTTPTILQKHIALAERLRVTGTPTFISRSRVLSGAPTTSALLEMVGRR